MCSHKKLGKTYCFVIYLKMHREKAKNIVGQTITFAKDKPQFGFEVLFCHVLDTFNQTYK